MLKNQPAAEHILQIAVNVPLTKTFSYLWADPLMVGTRVLVPFGHREVVGIVWDDSTPDNLDKNKLKKIIRVFDEWPPLPSDFLALVRFSATYYHHPIGQTLFCALPTLLRRPRPVAVPDTRAWQLTPEASHAPPLSARKTAQYKLWQAFIEHPSLSLEAIHRITPQGKKICQIWEKTGWLIRVSRCPEHVTRTGPILNKEQQTVLEAVSLITYGSYLLHGITGSGKTEVYLHLIKEVLHHNRQVLFLVPEISLTPQLIQRFSERFPDTPMVTLHSQLTDNIRLKSWHEACHQQAFIIIGTRLAVFTPLPALGLIVIDEEHDSSFKQQDEIRYHARDLAVWRARQANIPILLSSATPSLESMANVNMGRYQLLKLTHRAHQQARLPTIHLIDIRHQPLQEGLSTAVINALKQTLSQRQQSLVYVNRRGFSPVLRCPSCGWLSTCLHCSARLVLHLQRQQLTCHLCGYKEPVVPFCPSCGHQDLQALGQGTQRVEQTLSALLPQARILRVDSDTMHRKNGWHDFYERVQQHQVDILVGTQMLIKGHDFPNIASVIVLNADSGLYSADFRSAERLFAQLIQVSGRAGRAHTAGNVLVQTQWPDHPLYQSLLTHDVTGFLKQALQERFDAGFPPTTSQAILRADGKTRTQAINFLEKAQLMAPPLPPHANLYGPVPALVTKIKNRERAQLVLETTLRKHLHAVLDEWYPTLVGLQRHHPTVRWSLDVDPQEF